MTEAVFVGRSEEIATGQKAVDEASSGRGGLLLFSGEAGIGKTRLADEIAAIAARRDARVAWGRCWEAGGAPAYWPWIQIFRALAIEDDLFVLDATSDVQQARFRQFDRAAARLRTLASDQMLVLVLDDLHMADVPTLLLLHFIARDLRRSRLLVIGTYRDAEARLSPESFALLAKIAREGAPVAMKRLSEADILAWLRADTPDADDGAAGRIHRTTEGNALFVHELLRVRGTPSEGAMPDGLRAVLDEHLARVPAAVREVLALASVLGRDVEASSVAALSQLPLAEVERRLHDAHEAGVLSSPRGGKRLAFAHILLRERLYGEMPAVRRAELHVRAAEHLLATGGDVATVAHHFVEGRMAGSAVRAAHALLDAARVAQSRLAFEDAARLASTGVNLLADEASDDAAVLSCDLELVAGEARMSAGESRAGQETCVRAAERAKTIRSPERLARAALNYSLDILTGAVDPLMVSLLHDALAALPETDSCLRAKVLARLASARTPPQTKEEVPRNIAAAHEAIAVADRLDDDDTLLYVYKFASSALGYLATSSERAAHIDKIAHLVDKLGRNIEILNLGGWWIANLRERGDIARADEVLAKMKLAARDYPQAHYRWRIPMLEAQRAFFAGDIDECERLGREARAIEQSPSVHMHFAMHRLSIALVREDARCVGGEWDDVLAPLRRISGPNPFAPWREAAGGNREAARDRLEESLRIPESYPAMALAAEAVILLGDVDLAARVYPVLLGFVPTQIAFWSSHGSLFVGPTPRLAARLAVMLGKIDEARALYAKSIELCERMQVRPYLDVSRKALAALDGAPPKSERRPQAITMDREGDVWRICAEGTTLRVKDTKGLAYLADLIARPGQDLHVTQLAELADSVTGDAGPVLDAQAKAAYKTRVEDLRAELEEATRFGDPARAERAQEEIDAIADQLASAVGLGGRDRKVGSHVERARINVQRRLKDAIQRIAEHDPALGKYLSAAVKTGTYCSFTPF